MISINHRPPLAVQGCACGQGCVCVCVQLLLMVSETAWEGVSGRFVLLVQLCVAQMSGPVTARLCTFIYAVLALQGLQHRRARVGVWVACTALCVLQLGLAVNALLAQRCQMLSSSLLSCCT